MLYKITGETPFQVDSDTFSISPSESGYDLYISADGVNYSNFVTVASGVTKQMVSMNSGNFYKLVGNTSVVTVNWNRDCSGGGGGGTAGVSSLDGQTGALTTKTINGNAILGSGNIEISGGSEAYILDKMTQSERAEFCTNFLTLTDEEKIATLVYRDNVLCRYNSVESTKVWFTLDFFEVPSLYPYTQVRKFALKSDGSFEDSVNTKYPLGTSLNVDYSAHTITANQTTFAGFARGINNGLLLPYAIVTNNSTKILSTNNVTVEKTGYNDGIITVSFEYSGNSITGVWNFIGNTATLVSWTEGQPSPGGGGKTKLYYSLDSGTTQEAEAIAYLAVSSGLSAFCDTYELILLSNGRYYIPTQFSLDDVGDDEYWLTFYIQYFGNSYVDRVGMATKNRGFFPINQFWYSDNYNSVFMMTLNDLTGGTPTWRYQASFDDLKNLKDGHNNGKAFINIYLFYDLANEDKPYAVATAWRYDAENGNDDFYFYFDDIEVSTGTRYRGVYKWNYSNDSWTTLYWDTYKNYIASL